MYRHTPLLLNGYFGMPPFSIASIGGKLWSQVYALAAFCQRLDRWLVCHLPELGDDGRVAMKQQP